MKKHRSKKQKSKAGRSRPGGSRGSPRVVTEVTLHRAGPGDSAGQSSPPTPVPQNRSRRFSLNFDIWRLGGALLRGWYWLLAGACGCAAAGFCFGTRNAEYVATARLVHNPTSALLNSSLASETLRPKEPPLATVLETVKSAEVMRRASAAAEAGRSVEEMRDRAAFGTAADGEFLVFKFRDRQPAQAARMVNALAEEAVRATRRLQLDEFAELDNSLRARLAALERSLAAASQELIEFERANGSIDLDRETSAALRQQEELDAKAESIRSQLQTIELQSQGLSQELTRQNPALVAARSALAKALERYTDEHPKVQQLRAALAAAEAEAMVSETGTNLEVAAWGSPTANGIYQQVVELRTRKMALNQQLQELEATKRKAQESLSSLPEKQLACARIKARYQSLKSQRDRLAQHERDSQLLADGSMGCYRVFEPARADDAGRLWELKPGLTAAAVAALLGLFAVGLVLVGRELADGRIRSESDLKRVTQLPLLATLGDLSEMTGRERELWAFRTLKLLQGKLNPTPDQALVCGFISATAGEGRSTWVSLLSDAATKQGLRVLVVSADEHPPTPRQEKAAGAEAAGSAVPAAEAATADAVQALIPHPGQPLARVGFQDWVWDPVKRQQWQGVMQRWDALDHAVVFVELPPASAPEAILLADRLPKVIWLCAKDMASASETRSQMETLRSSRCNLAGAVFNRARISPWRRRFAHLVGAAALGLGLAFTAAAEEPVAKTEVATNTLNAPASLTISSPDQLAGWQKRLTLGPGDVLDVSLYEEAGTERKGLSIGPDGRLSYLEARDVEAVGLTVDELRKRLEDVLVKYHRFPRVVVLPAAYNSKKFFVLGNVQQAGVFSLSRPVTIVEAIAAAGGFVTSYQHRNALVQADLARSFLVRTEADGTCKRVPVDFEALFLQGNLTQNAALAPGDYLYFPPLDLQEVYVLGSVKSPGLTAYGKDLTVIGAITAKGGFDDKAAKGKVLVVRGSLSNPQTFVVDAAAILAAKAKDFPLQNRDILYVSNRPTAKAEELLESAITSFANAFVIGIAGTQIRPIITRPLFTPNR